MAAWYSVVAVQIVQPPVARDSDGSAIAKLADFYIDSLINMLDSWAANAIAAHSYHSSGRLWFCD